MAQWRLWTRGDAARVTRGSWTHDLRSLPTTTYEHALGGKIPRNHTARAYRLTVGNTIAAATTLQYRRMRNCLELSELLYRPDYEHCDMVIRECLRFILTDAYRCSGRSAFFLGQPLRGNDAADRLDRMMKVVSDCDVDPESLSRGQMGGAAGVQLYCAVTGLTSASVDVLNRLSDSGTVRRDSVCFLANSGVWSPSQIEDLLVACPVPQCVLLGGADPGHRHMQMLAMHYAIRAVLAGHFENFLQSHWEHEENNVQTLLDAPWPVSARVESSTGIRWLTAAERTPLRGWAMDEDSYLEPDSPMAVVVHPMRRSQVELAWPELLRRVEELTSEARESGATVAIATTADFNQLSKQESDKRIRDAKESGLSLLVAPQTFGQLQAEAERKLSLTRIMRR